MFLQKLSNLKYIFSTIRSSLLPSFFLLCALLYFFAANPFEFELSLIFHCVFLGFCTLSLGLLIFINRSKPFFTILTGVVCYLLINYLKNEYGADFVKSTKFQTLCFVLPFNLLVLYFLPENKLKSKYSKYLALILLSEIVLLENTHQFITFIPYVNIVFETMPLWAAIFWSTTLIIMAVDISLKNSPLNTGMFYMAGSLFFGTIYANSASGITIFFLSFALIAICAICVDLYYRYHYDYLENVESENAYLAQANSKFPFKYTIVLFCIDNSNKLQKAIGRRKYRVLEQMIVNKLQSLPYEMNFYRYNENELIAVFKNENAKHTKDFADNMRHSIAAAEFIFSDGQNIKTTISACVSEKTRKDLNASEVTERAHNTLNKGHHFNCNITMIA